MLVPVAISVIIPTRNRAALLAAALESFTLQSHPSDEFEVIVVDDGSTDSTKEVCRTFRDRLPIRYQWLSPSGISAAKNVGIFTAVGRLLLFFDDDDVADAMLLSHHVTSHDEHPEPGIAILGYTTWASGLRVSPAMRYGTEIGQNVFSYPCITHGQELGFANFWGGRTSCKRSLLVRHGIFNQGFTFGSEDIELGYRLEPYGLKVIFNKRAVSYANRPLSYADICRRSERQGRSLWLFSRLHPDAVVQDYCQVADAATRWWETSRTLLSEIARVRAIESRLETTTHDTERAALFDELWPLYRRSFEAFRLKGVVEAADGHSRMASCVSAAPTRPVATPRSSGRKARLVAFYLPQFHPIRENDLWWGKGFTEWTNVAAAVPQFHGHYQPHIPSHLGFCDLRVAATRDAQAALAAQHGIEAFCYWHYWFHGERLLELPFDEVRRTGKPEFPFCLAWANESWSRRWLGDDREILKKQTYSVEDDVRHARWLAEAFADPRYMRVNGRPLFLVYRPADLPDPRQTAMILRAECSARGLTDPYLVGVDAHCPHIDCRTLGFDGTLDFAPQLGVIPGLGEDGLKVHEYSCAREKMRALPKPWPRHPCVFVGWDNTPRRRQNAIVIQRRSADEFEAALVDAVESVAGEPEEQRLVFLNAWNEWGEGNHLEPDLRHGLADLEAVARATLCEGQSLRPTAGSESGRHT